MRFLRKLLESVSGTQCSVGRGQCVSTDFGVLGDTDGINNALKATIIHHEPQQNRGLTEDISQRLQFAAIDLLGLTSLSEPASG